MKDYVYDQLVNLNNTMTKGEQKKRVNVFGVVDQFDYRSNGVGRISLIDDSLIGDETVECLLYGDSLTHIRARGDILRCHRIAMSSTDRVRLTGTIAQAGMHVLLWSGEVDGDIRPYFNSATTATITDDDRNRVNQLRLFYRSRSERQMKNKTSIHNLRPTVFTRFSDVQPRKYYNFVCQVVSRLLSDRNKCFLRVWDGSKMKGKIFTLDTSCIRETLTNEELAKRADGLMCDICFYEEFEVVARQCQPGDVVLLNNVHALTGSTDMTVLTMHGLHGASNDHQRSIVILSSEHSETRQLIEPRSVSAPPITSSSPHEMSPHFSELTTGHRANGSIELSGSDSRINIDAEEVIRPPIVASTDPTEDEHCRRNKKRSPCHRFSTTSVETGEELVKLDSATKDPVSSMDPAEKVSIIAENTSDLPSSGQFEQRPVFEIVQAFPISTAGAKYLFLLRCAVCEAQLTPTIDQITNENDWNCSRCASESKLSLHWRILFQLCDGSSTISEQEPLPIFVIDSESYHNHFTSANYDPILLLKAFQKAPNKLISLFWSDVKSWIGKRVRLSRCEEKSESSVTIIRIVDMSVLE